MISKIIGLAVWLIAFHFQSKIPTLPRQHFPPLTIDAPIATHAHLIPTSTIVAPAATTTFTQVLQSSVQQSSLIHAGSKFKIAPVPLAALIMVFLIIMLLIQENVDVLSKIDKLTDSVDELNDKVKASEASRDELETTLADRNRHIDSWEANPGISQVIIKQFFHIVAVLGHKVTAPDKIIASFKIRITNMFHFITDLVHQVDALEAVNACLRGIIKKFVHMVVTLVRKINSLEAEIAKLRRDIKRSAKTVTSLQIRIKVMFAYICDLVHKVDDLEAVITCLQGIIKKLVHMVVTLARKINSLEADMAKLRSENKRLNQANKYKASWIRSLLRAIELSEATGASHQTITDSHNNEICGLKAKIAVLDAEKNARPKNTPQPNSAPNNAALETKNRTLDQELKIVKAAKKSIEVDLTNSHHKYQIQIRGLKQEKDKAVEDLAQKDSEIGSLKTSNTELTEQNGKLQDELEALKQRILDLEAQATTTEDHESDDGPAPEPPAREDGTGPNEDGPKDGDAHGHHPSNGADTGGSGKNEDSGEGAQEPTGRGDEPPAYDNAGGDRPANGGDAEDNGDNGDDGKSGEGATEPGEKGEENGDAGRDHPAGDGDTDAVGENGRDGRDEEGRTGRGDEPPANENVGDARPADGGDAEGNGEKNDHKEKDTESTGPGEEGVENGGAGGDPSAEGGDADGDVDGEDGEKSDEDPTGESATPKKKRRRQRGKKKSMTADRMAEFLGCLPSDAKLADVSEDPESIARSPAVLAGPSSTPAPPNTFERFQQRFNAITEGGFSDTPRELDPDDDIFHSKWATPAAGAGAPGAAGPAGSIVNNGAAGAAGSSGGRDNNAPKTPPTGPRGWNDPLSNSRHAPGAGGAGDGDAQPPSGWRKRRGPFRGNGGVGPGSFWRGRGT